MENKFINTVADLDEAGLNQLEQAVRAAKEVRRQKFDLADIKPGMTPEQRAKAKEDIARALREAGIR